LVGEGIDNKVIDSGSIEVSRRMKSLLIAHGIVSDKLKQILSLLKNAKAAVAVAGYELAADLKSELAREYEHYELTDKQAKALEKLQVERAASDTSPGMKNVLDLQNLRGVCWQSSWILSMEFFNWRAFKNAKQMGACAGLTPTPYDSGNSTRKQGISKAGNKRVRKLMV
jgi:transposase